MQMYKICKHKILDRLSDQDKKAAIASINASETLCKLLSELLQERIDHYDSSLESLIESPTELAGAIKCRAQLRRLTKLFTKTTIE